MPTNPTLAKIHIAKKELNLGDEIYRDILRVNSGKESAKDLTPTEAWKVLEHFKSLGWVPRGSKERAKTKYNKLSKRPGMASPAQLRKIEAMWMTGRNIRNKTPQGLRSFLFNKFKISDLRFVEVWEVGKIIRAIESIVPPRG